MRPPPLVMLVENLSRPSFARLEFFLTTTPTKISSFDERIEIHPATTHNFQLD